MLVELGDEKTRAMWRTYAKLVREAAAGRGGQEVKNLGDGFMVVFSSVLDAVSCAIGIQRAVSRQNEREPSECSLRVRIGLHAGEPIQSEEDYFGTAVVIAKRLCDVAEGGQILASGLVRRLVGSRGSYLFRDIEQVVLKGFSDPLPVCEVIWHPVGGDFSTRFPLPSLFSGIELLPFVGRQKEMAQLQKSWARSKAGKRQLVMLTGDGGIGKTRLAAEFALVAHG